MEIFLKQYFQSIGGVGKMRKKNESFCGGKIEMNTTPTPQRKEKPKRPQPINW